MEWKWNENCSHSAGNLFPGIFARNATERNKNIFKPMVRWHIGTRAAYEWAEPLWVWVGTFSQNI